MKKMIVLAAGCIFLFACNNEKKADNPVAAADSNVAKAPAEVPQSEMLTDSKYKDIGKNAMTKLSDGDVAGYLSAFADTAVYQWNNGDSLKGKEAITDYWTKRRKDVVDSLKYSKDIWLPIKVNTPQSVEAPGVWLLSWYMVEAKYKATGKKMVQWMHMDWHFNSADKIDRVIQYLDRAPINAAMTK